MSLALPSNLPAVHNARLPQTYEAAKRAIAECSRIDECKTWADQAEALASYARQAKDDELRLMADRIQARAIRRCGELLKQFDARGNHRKSGGAPTSSQRQMASGAGFSKDQQVTAVRVANVPEDEFEESVASSRPPTVTALAERGTKVRPRPLVDIGDRDPEDFAVSTQGQGQLAHFAEFCRETDAATVARGALPRETKEIRRHIAVVDSWLDKLSVSLEN